jgi:hypothetical protein
VTGKWSACARCGKPVAPWWASTLHPGCKRIGGLTPLELNEALRRQREWEATYG